MDFVYDFDGYFEYEVDSDRIKETVLTLFSKNYDIDIEKVRIIFNDDWLKLDKLKFEFFDELKEHFKCEAHKEYLERRLA